MSWFFLIIAIFAEIVATSALKLTAGFSRFWPTFVTISGYLVAFYFLSLSLRTIPIGIAYAVWSGVGIVAIALIGWWTFQQKLDLASYAAIGLIETGEMVMNRFSTMGQG